MRSDMSKVLVERPRWAHKDRYPRGHLKNRWGKGDEGPAREPMGRAYRTKEFSENFAPLIRFLRKSVGRPWDKVRSELCEHIACTNTVQKHVLDHLRDFVSENIYLVHRDVVVAWRHHGGFNVLNGAGNRPDFYVCPRSGLLKLAPILTSKRERALWREYNL